MARVKFTNSHLVSEKKDEIWGRIFQIAGTDKSADLAEELDRKENEVSNWKGARNIPLEFIVDLCVKYDVSIDYVLLGKESNQKVIFVGDPTVTHSSGTQQISGSTIGNGANIANAPAQQMQPELRRLVTLLEYYGSPALYKKIEKMVLDMYGDEK